MILRYPDYYNDFICKASDCRHSCCEGWALEIDEDTHDYYMSLSGPFGERIRSVMADATLLEDAGDDTAAIFSLEVDGRCPFLEKDGLCTIVKELGPAALCNICSTYPRSSFTYGDITELYFTLSCEEACRLHFRSERKISYIETDEPDAGNYEDEEDLLDLSYPAFRDEMLNILEDDSTLFSDKCRLLCDIVSKKQGCALNDLLNSPFMYDIRERMHILQGLEPIDSDWDITLSPLISYAAGEEFAQILDDFKKYSKDKVFELYKTRLLQYFLTRYMPSGAYDGDYKGKLLFGLFCVYAVCDILAVKYHERGIITEEDMQNVISRFSCEVEHSEENLDFLFEEFLF